jgi:hypothetical protein
VQGGGVLQALAQLDGGQHCPPGMIFLRHGGPNTAVKPSLVARVRVPA